MIVGKNYETKGFRVYLPKDRIVITIQHIKNVETLNSSQNAQLQAQLEREDPELRRTCDACEETEKRKEQTTAMPTTGAPPARARPDKTNTKSKKKLPKRNKLTIKEKKLAAGQDATGPKGVATEEQPLPAEEETETRMHTRFMGAKHMPVARVKGVRLKDPKNYREAMKDPRAKKWEQAIRKEIPALERNETWEVIKKPRNAKLLHSKWVFKLKTHTDGSIERYKARLGARGDQQDYDVNYTYMFSAVLDLTSSRLILVFARKWGVPARHGNVPSAYVKADKETNIEILLRIPLGMEISEALLRFLGVKDKRELALRLKKGLYGLKPSGRLWNFMLHAILVSLGFTQCYTDSCMYVKVEDDGTTLVGVYVDDLLVTGTSTAKVDKLFADMQVVELKDLGVVSKFLGISFSYDDIAGWELDQAQVIQEMLEKFQLDKAAPSRVTIDGEHDGDDDGELLPVGGAGTPQRPTVQTFQSLVGSLLWIARCTRPDIAFAVHRTTRHSHAPREGDWRLAKKTAKYLKGTKDTKLVMCGSKASLDRDRVFVEAYSDADYAPDKSDWKSVSGGVIMVAGIVVGWLCKKQSCVALSTMEAELVAASQTTAEVLGIVELLQEIGILPSAPSVLAEPLCCSPGCGATSASQRRHNCVLRPAGQDEAQDVGSYHDLHARAFDSPDFEQGGALFQRDQGDTRSATPASPASYAGNDPVSGDE
ncbi:unnamed protein product [Phytophthora fragariaefolia]|uniref:Unnamed protein product n=1 Tax=Phytophthora fragariaefolia TaxID=1490495 RepID=A0A9W7CWA3_9STRA|nr:unnamed protein product [Phytophthora fragariaefolia]